MKPIVIFLIFLPSVTNFMFVFIVDFNVTR